MNRDDELDRRFRDWLDDGPTDAPDYVIAAGLAAARRSRQAHLVFPWRNLMTSFIPRSPMLRLAAIVLLLAALVVAGLAASSLIGHRAPTVTQPIPSRSGPIAYATHGHVWILDTLTSVARRATGSPDPEWQPAWSPDGTKLAYYFAVSDRFNGECCPGLIGVRVIDRAGRQLAEFKIQRVDVLEGVPDSPLAWSPDGSQVAFADRRHNSVPTVPSIWVASLKDGSTRRLDVGNVGADSPSWSPDGSRIAFRGDDAAAVSLYAVWASGGVPTRLTARSGSRASFDFSASSWSPASEQIAFYLRAESGHDVYTSSADGSTETDVSNNIDDEYWVAWSPDGRQLAWQRDNGTETHVVIASADGAGARVLPWAVGAAPMAWSPDGSRVLTATCPGPTNCYKELIVLDVAGVEAPVVVQIDGQPDEKHPMGWSWARQP